ncbi:MAG TPA: hypothetical protein VEL73_05700 [Mycobacteriales bacterium]|nr:hypothetical protein [Mycobacteriales bacterium]
MDVFGVHRQLVADYSDFTTGVTEIRDAAAVAEIDAIAARDVFALRVDEVAAILDTFPVLRRREERSYGEFRTKRLVLERYDAMAEALRTGISYQTILDPPPAQGPRHPKYVERPR